jgi:hypothetical protein
MQSIENMTLSTFIQTFSDALQKRVLDTMKPVYTPKEETIGLFEHLKRAPFPAQAHTARAVFEALKSQSSVYTVGKMGSGKSQVSVSTISLFSIISHFQRPQRILVLCPPHLTSKWEREIKSILPDVRVVQLRELSQLISLKEIKPAKPAAHEFWILSRERAKLNHSWKPVWIKRTGKYACPSCGVFF